MFLPNLTADVPADAQYFIYRWWDAEEVLLYIGITSDVEYRTQCHRNTSYWMRWAVRTEVESVASGSRTEAEQAERDRIAAERPVFNKRDAIDWKVRRSAYLATRGEHPQTTNFSLRGHALIYGQPVSDGGQQLQLPPAQRRVAKEIVVPHGTYGGYTNHNCRCAECSDAARSARAAWREKLAPLPPGDRRHGTTNGYRNYRCRCTECRAAAKATRGAQRAAKS